MSLKPKELEVTWVTFVDVREAQTHHREPVTVRSPPGPTRISHRPVQPTEGLWSPDLYSKTHSQGVSSASQGSPTAVYIRDPQAEPETTIRHYYSKSMGAQNTSLSPRTPRTGVDTTRHTSYSACSSVADMLHTSEHVTSTCIPAAPNPNNIYIPKGYSDNCRTNSVNHSNNKVAPQQPSKDIKEISGGIVNNMKKTGLKSDNPLATTLQNLFLQDLDDKDVVLSERLVHIARSVVQSKPGEVTIKSRKPDKRDLFYDITQVNGNNRSMQSPPPRETPVSPAQCFQQPTKRVIKTTREANSFRLTAKLAKEVPKGTSLEDALRHVAICRQSCSESDSDDSGRASETVANLVKGATKVLVNERETITSAANPISPATSAGVVLHDSRCHSQDPNMVFKEEQLAHYAKTGRFLYHL